MIRPSTPSRQDPKRDELAKNVSFLDPMYMKRGAEALKKFLDLEKKGANPTELFQETNKFADPDTETGLFRGADEKPRFELTDQNMSIKPGVSSYFHPTKGGQTPVMPARQFIQHDELFDRIPAMGNIQTKLIMPETGSGIRGAGAYAQRSKPAEPHGYAEAIARDPAMNSPTFTLEDLMAHEIGGHGVQDYNYFLRGDNAANNVMASEFNRLVHPRVSKYRQAFVDDISQNYGGDKKAWAEDKPEAAEYLMAAEDLYKPSRGSKKNSALGWHDRYENVSGEDEARRVARRKNLTAQERREGPDYPWKPEIGAHTPYEFQLRRQGNRTYDILNDKDVLARLLSGKSIR